MDTGYGGEREIRDIGEEKMMSLVFEYLSLTSGLMGKALNI